MFLCLVSLMWESLWPSFEKVASCRLQLIIREVDLEAPFRYLGACMPQWQVFHIRRKVHIIGLPSGDSAGVQYQIIVHILWIVPLCLESHYPYWWFLSRPLTAFIIGW